MSKKTVRRHVFETNSSSSHSISIDDFDRNELPESFTIDYSQSYGWEDFELKDPNSLMSYFLALIVSNDSIYLLKKFLEKMDEWDIEITNIESVLDVSLTDRFHVDHQSVDEDWISDMLKSKEKFEEYLKRGTVYGGNDNG